MLKYLLRGLLAISLLVIGCAGIHSFSKKGLTREQRDFVSYLEKAGASNVELDTISILLRSLSPQHEIDRRVDLITRRILSQLPLEQQRIYYSLNSDQRLAYLIASDKDKWVKKRDDESIKRLCSTKEGKVQYFSLVNLLSKGELVDFIRCDSSGRVAWLKRYWAFKDPTPTTPRNEWEEEFSRRVGFSLESFHSAFGQRPWDDRGEVYIKLGEPLERELSADSSWKAKTQRMHGPVSSSEEEFYKTGCEVWTYHLKGKEIHFQFEDMEFVGYLQLVPHRSDNRIENLDYLSNFQVEKTKVETSRATYRHDYCGEPLDFAWEIIKFRNADNIHEILINTGIPMDELEKDSSGLFHLNQEIAVLNDNGEIIKRDSARITQRAMDSKNQLLVDQKSYLLSSGTYQIALEVKDLESKRIGLYQEQIFLPGYISADSFTQPALELSRAILSSEIKKAHPEEIENKFVLNGYSIVPNPGHIFLAGQEPEIKAYFEIYNLMPKDDTIKFSTISQVLKYVSADSALVSSDTVTTSHSGFVLGTIAYQIIPLIGSSGLYLEPGDYLWRIDVVDLNAPYKSESIINKLRILKLE